MSSRSTLTRRRRWLALSAAALLSAPLVLGTVLKIERAHSASALIPAAQSATAGASLADLVASEKPAVVTVTTRLARQDEAQQLQQLPPQFAPGSPFDEFFRQFMAPQGRPGMPQAMPQQQQQPAPTARALGSGFIISSDGVIVTNNHVIDGAVEIKVTLDDGSEHDATLVGSDPKTDLAVLRMDGAGKSLPTVSWGDSDALRPGDAIVAIGNPFGVGTTVTGGIVSARGRDLHNGPFDDFIQVDAAINHGNSGGPLFDMQGKVVGINTAIYSPNGGNVGVGFAIPSNQAQSVVATLVRDGHIERGYLGVRIQPVTDEIAGALGLKSADGALVASAEDGSPASRAGIRSGDVILSVDGTQIGSPRDLSRYIAGQKPGARDTLTVWRQGASMELAVTIGDDGARTAFTGPQQATPAPAGGETMLPELGMGIGDLDSMTRMQFGLTMDAHGAVVETIEGGKAADLSGLEAGDVILSVNQSPMNSARGVKDAVEQAKNDGRKSVLLQIGRGGEESFVAVPFEAG